MKDYTQLIEVLKHRITVVVLIACLSEHLRVSSHRQLIRMMGSGSGSGSGPGRPFNLMRT